MSRVIWTMQFSTKMNSNKAESRMKTEKTASNLNDKEVGEIREKILKVLKEKLAAQLKI